MKMKNIQSKLPTGHEFTLSVPADEKDGELIRQGLVAVIGGVSAIKKITDESSRRIFLIRFISSIIGEANAALHAAQMANKLGNEDTTKVVEDLLNSLHKPKGKRKK